MIWMRASKRRAGRSSRSRQRRGKTFRLVFPLASNEAGNSGRRQEPWLGEVRLLGTTGNLPGELRGHLATELHDGLTGETIPVAEAEVAVRPGEIGTFTFPYKTPTLNGHPARYLRLTSVFRSSNDADTRRAETPLLVITPLHPLKPLTDLRPAEAVSLNFNTTAGFRNADDIGTGTREIKTTWFTPDDRVWAYSRQLKQIGAKARTLASRLYVTADDLKHNANPWTNFPNGDYYWDVAGPPLLALAKKSRDWAKDDTVAFGFSDRWDNGPSVSSLYTWPELVAFDEFLRPAGCRPCRDTRARRSSRTCKHVMPDASTAGNWTATHGRSTGRLNSSRVPGKHFLMGGQGIPSVPQAYEAMFTKRLRGMIDDSTWGMGFDDPCFNTGKQMGYLMINPGWKLATLLQWGWNSSTLGNAFWWAPVGTTEPSRRHYYDRAWRAVLDPAGDYHSIDTYGYSTNGGASFTMSPNDWQEWWRLEERHSLLSPDAPLGAGVVLSTARWADPERTEFSGGGMGGDELDDYIKGLAQVIRHLHESGVDVSFAAPASALDHWPGNVPLILLNLDECNAGEIASLHTLARRGVHMAAFHPAGKTVRADAADLFSSPLSPTDGGDDRTGCEPPDRQSIRSGGSRRDGRARTGGAPYALHVPVEFPRGCAGYGYAMGTQRYIVVEDWREEARVASVRYHPERPTAVLHAVNVNDHCPLPVHRDGDDWLIEVTTRPGDGNLICLEEATE